MQEDYGQWFARGRAHQKAGRPIDAIVCYRRALRANRHAVQAQYRLGEALRDIGREDEAHRAWRDGLVLAPQHGGLLYCSAEVARRAGAYDEARATYRRVLAAHPRDRNAQVGHALSGIGLGEEAAYADLARTLADGASAPRWEELALLLAAAPPSAAQRELLRQLLATRAPELPPRLLALVAEALIAAGESGEARQVLARAEQLMTTVDDPEVVRHIALAAAKIGAASAWAECYAVYCAKLFASAAPVLWPRRSAGSTLRIAYLIAPDKPIAIGPLAIDPQSYLRTVIAGHPPERFSAVVYLVGEAPHNLGADWPAHVAISPLGAMPAAEAARTLGENDADVLIDLVGMNAPLGALLARRPARSSWTYAELATANVAPLITQALPGPESGEAPALARHRRALETMLGEYAASQAWFAESAAHSALQLSTRWRQAVAAHQAGEIDAAVVAYRELLAEQPGYAPAHYLLGALLRGRGQLREAAVAFGAAIDSAPAYTEPRAALANLQREQGLPARATELCRQGLALAPNDVPLWRALGMARLAQHDGAAARDAFRRALELEPDDATTHYNHGVALQMLHRRNAALRAYQRALALDPQLVDADFNIGVIFRDKGLPGPAIKAFEEVLARAPRHVAAHKALAETLLAQRRLGAWFDAFDRFRAACPEALPLAVLALEACQYRADFTGLDFYLDGLRGDRFKASSETELADCLEELLFLLLYFDLDQDTLFGLYKAYDSIAPRVYGQPLALPETRRPGRIRIGYLSGDLRNHVMGKMMWAALERHDRRPLRVLLLLAVERERRMDRQVPRAGRSLRGGGHAVGARGGRTHRRRRARHPGRSVDQHLRGEAGHPRAQAGARPDHARGERGRRRPVDDRLQAHRCVRRRCREPGFPARDAAADAGLRVSLPAHRAGRRAPVSPRCAGPRAGAGFDRRLRQPAEAIPALPRPVARGAGAHPARGAGHFPVLAGAAQRLRPPVCRGRHSRRARLRRCPRAGTTQRTRRATSSSISPSIRCPMAGPTARSRRSTCRSRW